MTSSGTVSLPGGKHLLPGYNPLTPGNGIPFGGPQNFIQIYEGSFLGQGRHQFRFGGSYNYLRDNRTFGAYETAGEYLGTSIPKSFENLLQRQREQLPGCREPKREVVVAGCCG